MSNFAKRLLGWLRGDPPFAREPRSAKEFADIVVASVLARSPGWPSDDIHKWLRFSIDRPFGHPEYGWSRTDAEDLADIFLDEASAW